MHQGIPHGCWHPATRPRVLHRTPSPASSRRLRPASGADGNPRPAHLPRARGPLLGGGGAVHNGQRRKLNFDQGRRRPGRRNGRGHATDGSGAQSHIIKRPRLTKLLDDSGARLILLVAPAGYGKTTLARQWLAAYRRPVAWYRASTASADVAVLATGLAVEIDAAVADGKTVTTDRMTSLAAVQQRPDILARALSRSREAWPRRLVIAIDDYHQVSGSADAEAFVGELVSLMPATFVITTRTRPIWCTPRQAVYGETVEVGTAELTMTEPEARQSSKRHPTSHPERPCSRSPAAGRW